MARAQSHLMTKIRGSVGGLTYSANQYHQIIMRPRTSPVQPNTTPQTVIRSAFDGAQTTWDSLTDAVQLAWEAYAAQTPFSGPLGDYTISGRQMFMAGRSLQNFVDTSGLAVPTFVTDAPPTFEGFLNPSNIHPATPVGPGTGIAVSVTADVNTTTLAFVQIQGPFTISRRRYKGPWDSAINAAAIIPAAATVLIEFLGLTSQKVYFTRVKCVADDVAPRISAQFFNRHQAVDVIA